MSNPFFYNKCTLVFNLLPFSHADSALCYMESLIYCLPGSIFLLKTNPSIYLVTVGFPEVEFNSQGT